MAETTRRTFAAPGVPAWPGRIYTRLSFRARQQISLSRSLAPHRMVSFQNELDTYAESRCRRGGRR